MSAPFWQTPQQFVPLSLQMQDSMEMPQRYDVFGGVDLGDLLGQYRGPADSEEAIASLQTEYADPLDAEQQLNWQQRLANRVSGSRFPDTTQEDRDMALRRGAGALGEVLLAAALAPDARSRAAVLARALPSAAGAFRQELGGIVKARDEQEDRAYQRVQREREGERYGYEKGQRERNVEEQGREDAERGALAGSGAEWRAQFERYISDKDINENERGALSSTFNTALSRFEANPSPKNADAVLAALSTTAKAANEYESLVSEATNELVKEAVKSNRTPEEVAAAIGHKELRDATLQRLRIKGARADIARGERADEKATRQEDFERRVLEAFLSGQPLSTPAGHMLIPDAPGVSVANPPRVSQQRMSELDREILKNENVRALAGSQEMAQAIDPETAGLIRMWIPDIQFGNAEGGALMLPANEYLKFREQWAAAGRGGQSTQAAPPTVAVPPPLAGAPTPKVMSRAEVQAAATKDGVSFDETVKRLEALLKRRVVVK